MAHYDDLISILIGFIPISIVVLIGVLLVQFPLLILILFSILTFAFVVVIAFNIGEGIRKR